MGQHPGAACLEDVAFSGGRETPSPWGCAVPDLGVALACVLAVRCCGAFVIPTALVCVEEGVPRVILICISLMHNDVQDLFMCLFAYVQINTS